jgi:CheY-like chemotaxis protein
MSGKIIIVEDDIFLQEFYKLFFKKVGREVVLLEDPDKVVKEIQTGLVDLIIMDVNLRNTILDSKRIDGIQFSRFIKIQFRSYNIPIILITAYPLSSLGDNVLEESMADDFLIKPIADLNKLVEKINKVVCQKNERQSINC